jgi:prevent-host-death family protein
MTESTDMTKKVNALKARKNLGQLLEEVYYRGDQYIIERAGKPMAAIVPVWQLEEWQKRRERFFATVEALHKQNQDIQEALQAVRNNHGHKAV